MSLTELKQYLRVDFSEDDAVLSAYLMAAREFCEEYQGKKYMPQTLELILDEFPIGDIEFKMCSPIQSVTSVKYTDALGTVNTVDPSTYILDKDSFVARLALNNNKIWPTVQLQSVGGIVIRFVAGYVNSAAVPSSIKQAIVLHIKTLYDDYKPEELAQIERSRNALLGVRRVVKV